MSVVSELGQMLLLAALAGSVGKCVSGSDLAGRACAILAVIVGLLPWVPGLDWTPSFYSRALLGDPAALGWVFLLHLLLWSIGGPRLLGRAEARALAVSAVAGACLIGPSSLGVPWAPDFYDAGFDGPALPTASLALAIFFAWRGWNVAVAGTAFGLLLYGLQLHESANLWDCLFDFPSVLVSLVILVRWGAGSLRSLRSDPAGAAP